MKADVACSRSRAVSVSRGRCAWPLPCWQVKSSTHMSRINWDTFTLFNRIWKLKQQGSKLNALELDVCSKSMHVTFSFEFSFRFAKIQTSNFRKVIRQHTEGVGEVLYGFVGNYYSFQWWNNLDNYVKNWQSYAMNFVYYFFGTQCRNNHVRETGFALPLPSMSMHNT